MNKILKIIENSCIEISNLIRNSSSLNLSKINDKYNISGDNVKKIDLISNKILKKNLEKCELIKCIGSEEEDELYYTQYKDGKYLICYDPLDGSSNIGVNITTGTIFALYEYVNGEIQDGNNIVMAGYCLYGGCTQLIIAKNNLNIYQLDDKNKFNLISESWKIPNKGNYYAINESNKYIINDKRYGKLTDMLIQYNYSARWVASLVADAHRTLIKGGIFMYPENNKYLDGRIRLLYEAYPFAYIFKVANGSSSNGKINLLDVPFPKNCHKKTPIILSSNDEMTLFNNI